MITRPDGKPRIEDFGNKPIKSPDGEQLISEEREPLTDIIEGDEDVAITVEIQLKTPTKLTRKAKALLEELDNELKNNQ